MEAEKSLTEDVTLWVLVVVAGLTVLGLYFWPVSPEDEDVSWALQSVDQSAVHTIRVSRTADPQFTLNRTESGWTIARPSGIRSDTQSIQSWVDRLFQASPRDRFSPQPNEEFGFAEDDPRIWLETESDTHLIQLGPQLPTGSGRYVRHQSEDQTVLFTFSSRTFNQLNTSLDDLRVRQLFSLKPEEIQQVRLKAGQSTTTYRRNQTGWTVEGRADDFSDTGIQRINRSLDSFLSSRAASFFDRNPDVLGETQAQVELVTGEQTVTVTLGESTDGNRTLRRTDWPVVSVASDPVRSFADLPVLPDNWPEPLAGGLQTPPQMPQSSPQVLPPQQE